MALSAGEVMVAHSLCCTEALRTCLCPLLVMHIKVHRQPNITLRLAAYVPAVRTVQVVPKSTMRHPPSCSAADFQPCPINELTLTMTSSCALRNTLMDGKAVTKWSLHSCCSLVQST